MEIPFRQDVIYERVVLATAACLVLNDSDGRAEGHPVLEVALVAGEARKWKKKKKGAFAACAADSAERALRCKNYEDDSFRCLP